MQNYCVYKFLDENNEIIYIGKTRDINIRMLQHFGSNGHLPKECYDSVKKIMYFNCNCGADMDILERYYIDKLKPKYNVRDVNLSLSFSFQLDHIAEWLKYDFDFRSKNNNTNKDIKQKTNIKNIYIEGEDCCCEDGTSYKLNTKFYDINDGYLLNDCFIDTEVGVVKIDKKSNWKYLYQSQDEVVTFYFIKQCGVAIHKLTKEIIWFAGNSGGYLYHQDEDMKNKNILVTKEEFLYELYNNNNKLMLEIDLRNNCTINKKSGINKGQYLFDENFNLII